MSRLTSIAGLVLVLVAGGAVAQDAPSSFDELLAAVRSDAAARSAENTEREQRFLDSRNEQQTMLDEVRADLAAENARSDQLKQQFDSNELSLGELTETLRVRVGNMGELFGVVRQVAGDTKGVIDTSLVSAQLPGRSTQADELAQSRGLPSIQELTDLYVLLLEEMAESGKVARFDAEVISAEGLAGQAEVVRVGVFNVISGDEFLQYVPESTSLQALARQPAGRFRSLAEGLSAATSGVVPMALDPSRGAILGLLIQAPSLVERIQQGGIVGYVIIVLGLLGVLVALERMLSLWRASRGIHAQLRSSRADTGNALGRILSVYDINRSVDNETLERKLDEAILREAPLLERWQGWIKVLAAVAPLLGLLGTVVGMIRTFQAITLFGTGDPKLMAGGISQALVTTVLGLCVAIPLVLLHSLVASRSKTLVEILEEQSAGIIARHSDKPAGDA
ncbi:MAG: MotA/TolQ/ExbB proton channel family protein [Gammaproteobacteria bacterium]|nr:MotA/TolQ/ExbB proton channel family protein [Gammaproteobacteria bacterium]MDH3506248.1 MotA/TolQ/ExbB proton channel family protein [Gammaproteobacteria bacterium]